jgi:hypothetical protein
MSNKWFFLLATLMTVMPGYLLWQGEGLGATLIAVPSFFIGLMAFWLKRLSDNG